MFKEGKPCSLMMELNCKTGWTCLVGSLEGALVSDDGANVGGSDGDAEGAVVGATVTMVIFSVKVNTSEKRVKFSEPMPVTGSHPEAAEKPCEQHVLLVQRLSPSVTSFANKPWYLYKAGLIQPKLGLPKDNLRAFTRDTILAKTATDWVLEILPVALFRMYSKLLPSTAMSG